MSQIRLRGMARRKRAFTALGLTLLGFCLVQRLEARWLPPFGGQCVGVIDGDTIEILSDGKSLRIRLEGVDTPELGTPYSRRAKQYTSSQVFGRSVMVVPKEYDRYGRLVARILVDDADVSVLLVEQGLAWHYTKYSDDPLLARAEKRARSESAGIWSLPNPEPPWLLPIAGQTESEAIYHGNRSSKVFHAPWCRYYNCKNCTETFSTREEAVAAGYKPGGQCNP